MRERRGRHRHGEHRSSALALQLRRNRAAGLRQPRHRREEVRGGPVRLRLRAHQRCRRESPDQPLQAADGAPDRRERDPVHDLPGRPVHGRLDCPTGEHDPVRGYRGGDSAAPFWFSRLFMRATGNSIEKHGLALVPGTGKTRHAFVAADDVASFLVRAVGHPRTKNATYELGGPSILTWDEAVATFARVLGRPVRPIHIPVVVYRMQQQILHRLSPAASNLMALTWWPRWKPRTR